MDLVTPGIGMIFWSSLVFLLLLALLRKVAWRPILQAVQSREDTIKQSLAEAENARKEMQNLQADNKRILEEAKKERGQILGDARKIKDQIVAQAKEQAEIEANKVMEHARLAMERERKEVVKELKDKVADLSVSMAEVILKEEFSTKEKQVGLVEKKLKDIKLN